MGLGIRRWGWGWDGAKALPPAPWVTAPLLSLLQGSGGGGGWCQPLLSPTVCSFQVTVMFAVAMGRDVWDDCLLCSLNGGWGSSSVWHKLSSVSTMELIGWAPKADPREILILTGKQLKGEIGALWTETAVCLWYPRSGLQRNTWFNCQRQKYSYGRFKGSRNLSVELEIHTEMFESISIFQDFQ